MITDIRAKPIPIRWQQPLSAFLEHCAATGRSAETIRSYKERLLHFARASGLHPFEVTPSALDAFLSSQIWAHETRRARLQTYRCFWRWATRTGQMECDPTTDLPIPKALPPAPHPLPYDLYLNALARSTPRTHAILRLAGELGLRRTEIARVHVSHITQKGDGWWLLVQGKGGRNRSIPIPAVLARLLFDLASAGFCFKGAIDGHLSPRHVAVLAQRLIPRPWTLHKLRHLFATRSYEVSRDILVVQRLLGHASPATTIKYVEVQDQKLRAVTEATLVVQTHGVIRRELLTVDLSRLTPLQKELVKSVTSSLGGATNTRFEDTPVRSVELDLQLS